MRYDVHLYLSCARDNLPRTGRIPQRSTQAIVARMTPWFCCATLACAAITLPATASAGAWTLPQGQFLFELPVTYLTADKAYDDNGHRVDMPRFEMEEISPYLEYGVTDDFTAGLQPKYRSVRVETSTGHETNSGLAESDLFGRLRMWHEGEAAFSIQGLVKVPIRPDEDSPAALGRDQTDAEVSLLYGNRHPGDSGTIFYNAEVGYRKRFKDPADELHANAFLGWSGQAWTVVVSSVNTVGLGNEGGGTAVLTQGPSFKRYDAQLSAGYKFSDHMSATAGIANTYAGENVGVGNSGFLGLVYRY